MQQFQTETTLADSTASSAERKTAIVVAVCLSVAAILMSLVAKTPGPQLPAFAAAFYPALAGIYLLTALLIDAEAKWHSSPAMVVLGNSFFLACVAIIGYLFVFPGALSPQGLFGALPHSSFWLWLFWHAGVVALIIAYVLLSLRKSNANSNAIRLLRYILPVCLLIVVWLVFRIVCTPNLLPDIRNTTAPFAYTPIFLLLRQLLLCEVVLGVATVVLLTRCQTVLNLWLAVVLWAQLLEILLGIGGQARYSYGWYFSRLHGGASALIILVIFLRSMAKLRDRVLRLNVELQQQASEDSLTGLANHRIFFQELRRAVARHFRHPSSLALILLDVDYFKRYNDSYGHPQGNVCLQAIASLLRECARRPDDLVARIGGEEFALLLPNTQPEGAQTIAENILRGLADLRMEHQVSEFDRVTVSIGIATCTGICRPTERILYESADQALYEAKFNGRNRIEAITFLEDADSESYLLVRRKDSRSHIE